MKDKLINVLIWCLAIPMALVSIVFGWFIWLAAKLGLIRNP